MAHGIVAPAAVTISQDGDREMRCKHPNFNGKDGKCLGFKCAIFYKCEFFLETIKIEK